MFESFEATPHYRAYNGMFCTRSDREQERQRVRAVLLYRLRHDKSLTVWAALRLAEHVNRFLRGI